MGHGKNRFQWIGWVPPTPRTPRICWRKTQGESGEDVPFNPRRTPFPATMDLPRSLLISCGPIALLLHHGPAALQTAAPLT